jgi:MFS superfamily sulfate permease-like transporter
MLGYMNGLVLTILVGQLPKLFGFSVDARDSTSRPQSFGPVCEARTLNTLPPR